MSILHIVRKIIKPTFPPLETTPFQEKLIKGRHAVKSFKARADVKRNPSERLADWMTSTFGSIGFLAINIYFFSLWLILNTGVIPGLIPYDPFPFGLLTTIVSLEAIILAIFVLISQNREQKVNDLREKVDVEIDIINESEVTKIIEMLVMLGRKQGINFEKDDEIQEMLKPLNRGKLEKAFEKEIL